MRTAMAMAMAMAAMVATLAGGCLSPPMSFGGGKSPVQAQRQGISKLLPAPLTAPRRWSGEVRVAKVRVWADAEYRAQNVQWQHGFEDQLDAANQVLVPLAGVRLEAEHAAWERHAPGATLAEHLEALARHDPGDDVAWVVGLTSALSLASATFDQLGVAHLGGRHLVVRGHADLEERKDFERAFPDLDQRERDGVLEARRRHKTTGVLIHELAHSLGALHEASPESLLAASYSHLAVAIGERNRELMLISLEERLAPAGRRDPRATAQRLLAALEAPGAGGWVAEDRAEAVAQLRAQLDGPPGAAPGAAPGAGGTGIKGEVPAAVSGEYRRASELLAAGDHRGAAAALEPLVAAYPAHAELRLLGCRIELARGGAKDARAIAACERAAQLSGGVEPAIALAGARLAAGDAAGWRATLEAAEARLASLRPEEAAPGWLALAAEYHAREAVTWAEDALARAGAAGTGHAIAQWAGRARVRYGIPRAGARWKLAPADDGAAMAAVRGVLQQIGANKLVAAHQAATAAEKKWPGLPGLLAVRCDVELRRGAFAEARRLCARASERGRSSWAVYLLGILELRDHGPAGTATGIKRLREAIALDPELGQAWRALAKALDRARDAAALEQLRRDHQARFGQPLR